MIIKMILITIVVMIISFILEIKNGNKDNENDIDDNSINSFVGNNNVYRKKWWKWFKKEKKILSLSNSEEIAFLGKVKKLSYIFISIYFSLTLLFFFYFLQLFHFLFLFFPFFSVSFSLIFFFFFFFVLKKTRLMINFWEVTGEQIKKGKWES